MPQMTRTLPCLVLVLAALAVASVAGPRAHSEENPSVKIALCQIFTLDGDRPGNFVRIENALKEAVEQGAEIVCFPEMAILGWVKPEAHEQSFPIPGEDSDRLCALAKKYGVFLCIGLGEKDGEDLYNTVILLDDQGQILLKHHKMNTLDELMEKPYTRGKTVGAVDTKHGRIGLLICADTFVGEHLDAMAAKKPDLLLVPYGWAAPNENWPEHGKNLASVVANAAKVTGAHTIGTDCVGTITHGPWRGQTYGGQSVAANNKGEVLGVAADRDREVMIVEVEVPASR